MGEYIPATVTVGYHLRQSLWPQNWGIIETAAKKSTPSASSIGHIKGSVDHRTGNTIDLIQRKRWTLSVPSTSVHIPPSPETRSITSIGDQTPIAANALNDHI